MATLMHKTGRTSTTSEILAMFKLERHRSSAASPSEALRTVGTTMQRPYFGPNGAPLPRRSQYKELPHASYKADESR